MKKLKRFLLTLVLILPCSFFLFACSSEPYIVSFEKTSSVGTTDTYTITYSNGKTQHFSVENGKDGTNGTSLTVAEIQQYCTDNGMTIEDFFDNYLDIVVNLNPVKSATNKAIQSAVSIFTEENLATGTNCYAGAGVIYKMNDDYTYIITNYHVTHTSNLPSSSLANKISIYQYGENEVIGKDKNTGEVLYDDAVIECEYVGGSERYDIAIIKAPTSSILANNPNACEVEIATSYALADTVIAIGNPSGSGLSVTQGIVSVVSEQIKMDYDNYVQYVNSYTAYFKRLRVMRIDAAVNGGNSGGGLFNTNGELIGIVNAKVSSTDIENIAYAIPVDNVVNVAESILYNASINHSPTQVKFNINYTEANYRSVYDNDTKSIYILNDIVVSGTPEENSLGSRIGFADGDIIKSCQVKRGDSVTTYTFNRSYNLTDLCLILREGDSISFVVNRDSSDITLGSLESTFILSRDVYDCDSNYIEHESRNYSY